MHGTSKRVRFALWVALAAGCGSVAAAPDDAGGAGAGNGDSGSAGSGGNPGVAGAAGNGSSAGASGVGGAADEGGAGGRAGSGAGGAPCTPASVALTAGSVTCNCGGTCAPCPAADGPTCGGSGAGHLDWQGCTVGGAPYRGCASPPDGGAVGYCCANNCSLALCEL